MFKEWGGCVVNGAATFDCLPVVFSNLLSAILVFAGLVTLAMFILGSIKYMNSNADPKKAESARNNFKYGLLGLIIILSSFVIMEVIAHITGVTCILNIANFPFACRQLP